MEIEVGSTIEVCSSCVAAFSSMRVPFDMPFDTLFLKCHLLYVSSFFS